MVIFTMFVDMTALSNNITNRDGLWRVDSDSVTISTSYSEKQDGLWRVDSDSVTISTSYSEKQPEKLNVYIYNHSNSTIYIGRTYGLLMQVDGEWKYIAKGRNQKCITIWPASKRNFQVSLCAKKIKSSSGWAYRTDSLYKVRFDVYDSDGIFIDKMDSNFKVSGNIVWHLTDGLVIIHLD